GRARRAGIDAGVAEQALPMACVPRLGSRELEEHLPPPRFGIVGEHLVELAAGELVRPHLADALQTFGVTPNHRRWCAPHRVIVARTTLRSVANGMKAQTVRWCDRPCERTLAAAQYGGQVTGPQSASAHVDHRPDDRSHHLPAERVCSDLVLQYAVVD